MPMNKRTESIRLKHLQDIYYEKLQGIAYDVYDEQLHNLIIRPEELDADVRREFYDKMVWAMDTFDRNPPCKISTPVMHRNGNTFMK